MGKQPCKHCSTTTTFCKSTTQCSFLPCYISNMLQQLIYLSQQFIHLLHHFMHLPASIHAVATSAYGHAKSAFVDATHFALVTAVYCRKKLTQPRLTFFRKSLAIRFLPELITGQMIDQPGQSKKFQTSFIFLRNGLLKEIVINHR